MINGTREPGFLYSFYGDKVRYGCYVSNPSADKKTLVFDDSEVITQNPDVQAPPLRPEEYANIAIVYGEVFMLSNEDAPNIVLDDQSFPSAGWSRNDIVYLFVGDSGSTIAISEGTSSDAAPVDPAIPRGSEAIARVVVDSTGIVQIEDLRHFVIAGDGSGTIYHNLLENRGLANQHTTAAITGLDVQLAEKALQSALDAHEADMDNPHGVTADQTGAITYYEQVDEPTAAVGSIWNDLQ